MPVPDWVRHNPIAPFLRRSCPPACPRLAVPQRLLRSIARTHSSRQSPDHQSTGRRHLLRLPYSVPAPQHKGTQVAAATARQISAGAPIRSRQKRKQNEEGHIAGLPSAVPGCLRTGPALSLTPIFEATFLMDSPRTAPRVTETIRAASTHIRMALRPVVSSSPQPRAIRGKYTR
jgi:hypothetical protein